MPFSDQECYTHAHADLKLLERFLPELYSTQSYYHYYFFVCVGGGGGVGGRAYL